MFIINRESGIGKVAHVHGYWPSQKDDGPYHQGLRGELITRLSAQAFHQGYFNALVATNGPVWGEGYDPVGKLMKDDWMDLDVPEEKIVIVPEAVSTFDENRLFVEQKEIHGWTDLSDVAFGKHHWVIPSYYPKGLPIEYISAERLAREVGTPEDRRLMRSLWVREIVYAAYLAAQKGFLLAGQAERLKKMGAAKRVSKGRDIPQLNMLGNNLLFLATDKYDL